MNGTQLVKKATIYSASCLLTPFCYSETINITMHTNFYLHLHPFRKKIVSGLLLDNFVKCGCGVWLTGNPGLIPYIKLCIQTYFIQLQRRPSSKHIYQLIANQQCVKFSFYVLSQNSPDILG